MASPSLPPDPRMQIVSLMHEEPTAVANRLESLPAELLHEIFGHLPLKDALAARFTSLLLAEVGAHHLRDQLCLDYDCDSIRTRTNTVARHPAFAKQIRQLEIGIPLSMQMAERELRRCQHCGDENKLSPFEHAAFFRAMQNQLHWQHFLTRTDDDFQCFVRLFQHCFKLDTVKIRILSGIPPVDPDSVSRYLLPYINSLGRAPGDAWELSGIFARTAENGADQLMALLSALKATKHKLKSLSVVNASFVSLDSAGPSPGLMREVLKDLHSFDFRLGHIGDSHYFGRYSHILAFDPNYPPEWNPELNQRNALGSVLRSMSHLRTLRLAFAKQAPTLVIWTCALRNASFPHLHTFEMRNSCGRDLTNFLNRHRKTLVDIEIHDVAFEPEGYMSIAPYTPDPFVDFLNAIAGRISHLQAFNFYGTYPIHDYKITRPSNNNPHPGFYYRYDSQTGTLRCINTSHIWAPEIERYIIQGGREFPDLQDLVRKACRSLPAPWSKRVFDNASLLGNYNPFTMRGATESCGHLFGLDGMKEAMVLDMKAAGIWREPVMGEDWG